MITFSQWYIFELRQRISPIRVNIQSFELPARSETGSLRTGRQRIHPQYEFEKSDSPSTAGLIETCEGKREKPKDVLQTLISSSFPPPPDRILPIPLFARMRWLSCRKVNGADPLASFNSTTHR